MEGNVSVEDAFPARLKSVVNSKLWEEVWALEILENTTLDCFYLHRQSHSTATSVESIPNPTDLTQSCLNIYRLVLEWILVPQPAYLSPPFPTMFRTMPSFARLTTWIIVLIDIVLHRSSSRCLVASPRSKHDQMWWCNRFGHFRFVSSFRTKFVL